MPNRKKCDALIHLERYCELRYGGKIKEANEEREKIYSQVSGLLGINRNEFLGSLNGIYCLYERKMRAGSEERAKLISRIPLTTYLGNHVRPSRLEDRV